MTNDLRKEKGRWINHPEEELLDLLFIVDIKKMRMNFNARSPITSAPFDARVIYSMVNLEASDWNRHNPKGFHFKFHIPIILILVLDQSNKIDVQLRPINLKFNQKQYTYLLRCLDLNINYIDDHEKEFQFSQIPYYDIEGKLISFILIFRGNQVYSRFILPTRHYNFVEF